MFKQFLYTYRYVTCILEGQKYSILITKHKNLTKLNVIKKNANVEKKRK